jgi:hypothetical protein
MLKKKNNFKMNFISHNLIEMCLTNIKKRDSLKIGEVNNHQIKKMFLKLLYTKKVNLIFVGTYNGSINL